MQNRRNQIILIVLAVVAVGAAIIFWNRPGFLSGRGQAADTLTAIEQLTPEITALSAEIKKSPSNPGLYYSRANAYFGYGNLKYAQRDYQKAYDLDSSDASYVLGLSDCLFDMNDVNRSIEILESYERRLPGNPDILLNLAVNYFLLPEPRYQLAIDRLNDLIKIDMQNPHAYFYKGLIYQESGDTLKAISNYQTCTEVDPDYYDAWMQLGLLHAAQGDPLAIKYYDNAVAVGDSSREAAYAKAKFFQDQGDVATAIDYYRKLVVADPQDAESLYNLATIYYGVDSIEKAYRYFDMAIKQSPAKAYAHYGKGLCAKELGKNEEAITYLQQAITLGVSEADVPDIEKMISDLKAK
jgi:tetratricopeptide (TPR) repeat protein